MADSNTPNIGLLVADPNDVVQYASHIGNNLTTIDGLMGAVDCTSVTRPTNTYKGQIVYEHDTGRYAQNTGTKASPVWTYMSHQAIVSNSSVRPTGGLTTGELLFESDSGVLRPRGASAWLGEIPTCTVSTLPANPLAGDLVYLSDLGAIANYTGSQWRTRSPILCTSSTHPANTGITLFNGMQIFETDTELSAWYNGSTGYIHNLQELAPFQSVSGAANVTFTGLPAVNRLLVVWRLRSSTAGSPLGLQIDADTTSGHYVWAKMTARTAAVSASGNSADTNAQIGTVAGSSTANYFSSGETWINGWNATNGYCNLDSSSSCWDTSSSYWIDKMGSQYVGAAAAHTSIKIVPGSGTLTGEVAVYGGF